MLEKYLTYDLWHECVLSCFSLKFTLKEPLLRPMLLLLQNKIIGILLPHPGCLYQWHMNLARRWTGVKQWFSQASQLWHNLSLVYSPWDDQIHNEMLHAGRHLAVFSAQRGTFKEGLAGWKSWQLVCSSLRFTELCFLSSGFTPLCVSIVKGNSDTSFFTPVSVLEWKWVKMTWQ